jgi:hypothetical protein
MTPEERAKEIVKWLADLLKPWTAFYGHEEYFEHQIREAIAAETERCARIADDWASNYERKDSDAAIIAAAIRARRDG